MKNTMLYFQSAAFAACACLASFTSAQVADAPDAMTAGVPVNYTEDKAGTYTLPDPLKMLDGKPVRDAKTWFTKRRPEIVRLFEENQYGRAPERPADMSFDVLDKGTPSLNVDAHHHCFGVRRNRDPPPVRT
jgi:hypothetical protein